MMKPLYKIIIDELSLSMESGIYKPNEKLPSEADLMRKFDTSRVLSLLPGGQQEPKSYRWYFPIRRASSQEVSNTSGPSPTPAARRDISAVFTTRNNHPGESGAFFRKSGGTMCPV